MVHMATVYATYCSAPKRTDDGDLPAIERYLSERIRSVDGQAQRDGASFLILSGTYGLITREAPLPWYDHLLAVEEIPAMAAGAQERLRADGIAEVVWFTVHPDTDPYVTRYGEVLRRACEALQIPCRVEIIDADD